MQTIEFSGPDDDVRLVGDLTHSDRACAVVMVHGLMSDKNCGGLFPMAAAALRERGWGSLRFDMRGNGESDDACMSPGSLLADVRAAISLMRSLNYKRLALWGHGLGSRMCVELHTGMACMVLTDALLGRRNMDWSARFTKSELLELAATDRLCHQSRTGPRRHYLIERSLLDSYQRYEPGRMLPRVRCPVLVLSPGKQPDQSTSPDSMHALMRLLPDQSEYRIVRETAASVLDRPKQTAALAAEWIDSICRSLR